MPIRFFRCAVLAVAGLICLPASASHLVTGNGFGFSVVAPESGTATKFYAHPYSFVRPDPANPLSEGIETANFIKELGWGGGPATAPSTEYGQDSHVIHVRRSDGEGFFFMPFGLHRAALVISWEPPPGSTGAWQVAWTHAVASQTVAANGASVQVLKF